MKGSWLERNVSLSSVGTNHRALWQVHVASLMTWHPDLELQSPCCTAGLLPLISFFIYQSDPSPHAVDVQTKTSPLIWKECNASPAPLPITPGGSTLTNDIDCNGLPCEGAPFSYFWFDFNLNIKVWSQTGQETAEHFTWESLELISLSVWTLLQGVDGKQETL